MTDALTKAEKLARAMENFMSGGRVFDRRLAAQIRDELRRMDRAATPPSPVEALVEALRRIKGHAEYMSPCAAKRDILGEVTAALAAYEGERT